jgi:hypothetical protein
MLFQAVMKFLSRLVEFKILVNWGMVHSAHFCIQLTFQGLTSTIPLPLTNQMCTEPVSKMQDRIFLKKRDSIKQLKNTFLRELRPFVGITVAEVITI